MAKIKTFEEAEIRANNIAQRRFPGDGCEDRTKRNVFYQGFISCYREMNRSLTINQIMLLLDIYRGTATQHMGTMQQDIEVLKRLGLIMISKGDNVDYEITDEGEEYVQSIKSKSV